VGEHVKDITGDGDIMAIDLQLQHFGRKVVGVGITDIVVGNGDVAAALC
jgi:hypothetical protein